MASETVELRGHIIDSLILPKVLDEILTRGANFKIAEIKIGQNRVDQSYARIDVSAPSADKLSDILLRLRQHGAEVIKRKDVQLAPAPADGVFPDDFYVTTNQQNFVQLDGREIPVESPMMDSAIAVDREKRRARTVKFFDVRKGDLVVVGHEGIRVQPVQRDPEHNSVFNLNASVSAETPKSAIIREIARELHADAQSQRQYPGRGRTFARPHRRGRASRKTDHARFCAAAFHRQRPRGLRCGKRALRHFVRRKPGRRRDC